MFTIFLLANAIVVIYLYCAFRVQNVVDFYRGTFIRYTLRPRLYTSSIFRASKCLMLITAKKQGYFMSGAFSCSERRFLSSIIPRGIFIRYTLRPRLYTSTIFSCFEMSSAYHCKETGLFYVRRNFTNEYPTLLLAQEFSENSAVTSCKWPRAESIMVVPNSTWWDRSFDEIDYMTDSLTLMSLFDYIFLCSRNNTPFVLETIGFTHFLCATIRLCKTTGELSF